MVDDPLGGVVNHAPDAAWLVAMQDRARRAAEARRMAEDDELDPVDDSANDTAAETAAIVR